MKPHPIRMLVTLCSLMLAPLVRGGVIEFTANLSGALESPPNTSPGTGFADVFLNDVAQTLEVKVTFSGLLFPTTASHIHAPTASPFTGNAGVATTTPFFPGFPIGVTSGTYDHTLDLTSASSYNPAFVTAEGSVAAAEAALIAALDDGESYLNIHTTQFPAGEIRGYLAEVPETSCTAGLLGLTLLVLLAFGRRTLTTSHFR